MLTTQRGPIKLKLAAVGLAALVGSFIVSSPVPAVAADVGCGYGSDGPSADTICWLDMTNFDPDIAQAPGGQAMSIALDGGLTINFTARLTPGSDGYRPVVATAFPTWSGTPIGNTVYKDTPGKAALYQVAGNDGGQLGTVSLDNIVVRDDMGNVRNSGYAFVMADAESSNKYEGFTFESTSPIEVLANITPTGYNPACGGELSGVGSSSLTCIGQGVANAGDIVTYTNTPSKVSISFRNDNDPVGNVNTTRQAAAFGVMFAKVSVTKDVASRYSSDDQFTVSTGEGSSAISTASTSGTAASATTGPSTILTTITGSQITFSETAASPSVDWAHYNASWTCTNNGTAIADSELTYSTDRRSVTATVGVGEYVACTVTNSANLGEVSWNKVDPDGDRLAGSEWTLTPATGGAAVTVVDNGAGDEDPADGVLKVSGLTWGDYSLVETKAPNGYTLSPGTDSVTIGANALVVTIGDIENTRTTGEVSWNKVDPDGDRLAGSEWTLTPATGGAAVTVVDNGAGDEDPADGVLKVSGLTWGDYSLVETKAPNGYTLSPGTHSVTIGANALVVTIGDIVNEPVTPPNLAFTGNGEMGLPIGVGILALMAGLAAILVARRRSKV